MASTDYNLKLKITADNQASAELDKVSKSTQNLQKQSFQWSKSTETALKRVGATATVVAGSMVALGKSFVDASIENEPLQRSFERLSESAGVASEEMLKAMKKASRGTVSDTKLMASANKAYSLGVVKNVEDMSTIMEIARVKGQAMGRTMEEALDDIVTGLGRGSVQILDNLGIVIKQTEAQEIYAQMLGKTVDQLTEAEKKQALVNAVVKQGKEELAQAGEVQETMQEKLSRVNAQWENMKVTIGNALLPVVDRLLTAITPIIEKVVNWIEENPKLTATIMGIVTAIAGLTAVVSGLALALPAIGTAITALSGPIGWIIGAITLVATARINNWGGIQEKTKQAVEYIERIIGPRLDKLKARWTEHGETVMIYVEEIMGAIADTIGTTLSWIAVFIAGTFEGIDASIKLFKALWNGDWEEVNDIAVNRAINMDNLLTDAFGDTRTSIKTGIQDVYDWIVNKLNAIVDSVKNIVGQIKDAWNGAKTAVSNFGNNITSGAKNAWNNVTGMFKANGGSVSAGSPYIVGERGPELFVPSSNGNIIPNEEITKNNNVTINMSGITIREDADIQKLANEIVRMTKLEKNYGII